MIKLKKMGEHDLAQPQQATQDAAGFDLRSAIDWKLYPGQRKAIPTGFAWELPLGMVGHIWPRSGLAVKQGVDTLAGVVDADFRGEVCAVLINHGDDPVEIKAGDRIAQMVVVPYYQAATRVVEELDDTDRGAGGFGSTGTK